MGKPADDPFDLSTTTTPVVAAGIEGEIQPKPRASIGLSKKVVYILFGVGALFLLIFMMSIDNVGEQKTGGQSKKEEDVGRDKQSGPNMSGLPADFKSDKKGSALQASFKLPAEESPANGQAPAGTTAQPSVPAVPPLGEKSGSGTNGPAAPGAGSSVLPGGGNGKSAVPSGTAAQPNALSPEEQRAIQAKTERAQREMQARLGGLDAKSYSSDSGSSGGGNGAMSKETAVANAVSTRLEALGVGNRAAPGAAGSVGGGAASSRLTGGNGGSDQDEKLKFLNDSASTKTGYHPYTVAHPISKLQLNSGSFIPAVLEMAVNSDLPGMVTARIRENVYDSVTGKCLLMPSGMKVVGGYNSKVATGQSRQLVVWNQATYPNGDQLDLAGMGSADVSGQSGLAADVDNHWLRLFGVTLGMSMVTAGVQMSVPAPSSPTIGNGTPSYAQTVSAALSQQYGQLGAQMLGKYLNVQPTLRNYPGERFNIVVPKNIVFPGCYRG